MSGFGSCLPPEHFNNLRSLSHKRGRCVDWPYNVIICSSGHLQVNYFRVTIQDLESLWAV